MKVKQSGPNKQLQRLQLAPGNGDFEPLCGYVEIVFSGYTLNDAFTVYKPAKIRINISASDLMEFDEVKEWRDVLDIAVGLSKNKPLYITPENVLKEWEEIKTLLAEVE